mgnify:CR=1 FL=1
MFIEPLVTKSKEDTTHSRRVVFSYLKQKEAVTELFRTIAPKIASVFLATLGAQKIGRKNVVCG